MQIVAFKSPRRPVGRRAPAWRSRSVDFGSAGGQQCLVIAQLTFSRTVLKVPLAVALSVADATETFAVVTVKVLLCTPAGMTMLVTAGLATDGWLLESVTVMLPGAAGFSSVTVAVALFGPTTGLGVTVKEATPTGRTLSAALLVMPL